MNNKTEVFRMRVPADTLKEIRKVAIREGRSYQSQINYMLKKQLEDKNVQG